MNEPFLIPVNYQGQEQVYKARFDRWGNTHRISVLIGETTIVFELDEGGSCCALSNNNASTVSPELLQALAQTLIKLIE